MYNLHLYLYCMIVTVFMFLNCLDLECYHKLWFGMLEWKCILDIIEWFGAYFQLVFIDLLLHDTYYVVGHFHYVLSMRAVFSLIMRWYFWVYVFTGLRVSEFFSWVFLVGFFISVNVTFLPMHTLRL